MKRTCRIKTWIGCRSAVMYEVIGLWGIERVRGMELMLDTGGLTRVISVWINGIYIYFFYSFY